MLHLPRRVIVQLAVFTVIAVGVLAITFLHFVRLPAMLFGVGRYTVTMELVEAGGLYRTGNVTYRGFEVGRVAAVRLTDTGVQAVLALKSGIDIPSDLKAEVHSHTAIGETYVELLPRNAASPPLKNGDVIALADTSVPPDINDLLSAANTALEAIPHENLQTVIDESYTAVAGLGLELSRLIKGSAELAIDARANLDPLVALIDRAGPVLDSQTHTSDAIAAWAAQLAAVTGQLQTHDSAVGDLIDRGGPALGETRQLLERLQPTVPGHAVYRTMMMHLLRLARSFGVLPVGGWALRAIVAALLEWQRKSELSGDRAGLLCAQDLDTALRVEMKLAGGCRLDKLDSEAFLAQAREYETSGDMRDGVLKLLNLELQTHPFSVLRAAALTHWVDTGGYAKVIAGEYPRRADDGNAKFADDLGAAARYYRDGFDQSNDPLIKGIRDGFGGIVEGVGRAASNAADSLGRKITEWRQPSK